MRSKIQNGKFTEVILDSLGEGLFTVDKDFRVQTINRAAERLLGIKREKVLGDFCKNVFRTVRCLGECPIQKVLEDNKNVFDLENEMTHASGRRLKVQLNAAVLREENGEPIGGVISFRDITHLEEIHKNLFSRTNFHGIIGTHKSMQEIYDLIEEVADSDSSVLIQGESGTGKELIANAIQKTSKRRDKPFIKVNCSVFPPDLLASELFGHVKGAFTDAVKDRVGRFEMADGGTIFLDEIAEMPLQMQVHLLRVLQEGTFERVGESVTRKVNVRIIAATNKDIRKEMMAGRFREDLYYRLNVIPIYAPPLRERKCDIPHLVRYFMQKFSLLTGKKIKEIDDEAMDLLLSYAWPGNVRELENTIEYAFARTKGNIIHASKLPPNVRLNTKCLGESAETFKSQSLPETSEPQIIRHTLEKVKWNRSKAAEILGMGRTTLWRKMRQYGLLET
ncbi:PAS modulated sigma54 specific transcriptional regulator, Fis family [Caldithrix abyssi DSM 13497]|uniref:PAS domain S-box-containing protein n=1 Tax=Caldithrix abyssi DSM 13497 TaxID=880073 RepID=H1XXU0_CALAY|nr:sigma-54-dependent Fis family transcriptional regulator [Caldithrix abyssi]APF19643.1 PAS domain S-box-containing protein [Caldithrix abyssi DSM 13497]EHO39763.1 PAS modulated sigma54 specific transcriptional regulator, Fis family [Caldithrix abyssi DSM 13497]